MLYCRTYRKRALLKVDCSPSRWEAQADAVSTIFNAKTGANPESSVGLMSMGGKGPEVLVTLTTDFGKILAALHRTKPRGSSHLATGIQIAGVRCHTYNFTLSKTNATLAGPQASPEQVTKTTHHCIFMLSDTRRREEPHQASQEDEEE